MPGRGAERSTLADWVGSTSGLMQSLVEALAKQTFQASKLHAGRQACAGTGSRAWQDQDQPAVGLGAMTVRG
jgi:hypothetical protein